MLKFPLPFHGFHLPIGIVYACRYQPSPPTLFTLERGKKTSRTGRGEKTTSRTGQAGVHQVPEGSGEEGKMEETGCEIICGALMTLTVEG